MHDELPMERRGSESGSGLACLPPRTAALLELVDDPDPGVWTAVRKSLLGLAGAEPRVRRALVRLSAGAPARLRIRARELLATVERREIVRRLQRRAARISNEPVCLESSLFLLGRLAAPALDARPYRKALAAMAERVRIRAAERPPESRGLALVDVLARDLGYEGDRDDYHHPDNIHLHRVIERKLGLPLTLTALYLSVARRAGISAVGVALPGHVVLRVRDGHASHLVDPFSRGRLLTRRECVRYLTQHHLPGGAASLRDASEGELFARQVRNLEAGFRSRGLTARAREVARVRMLLERDSPSRHRHAD